MGATVNSKSTATIEPLPKNGQQPKLLGVKGLKLCPHNPKGGGHIVLGADLAGAGVGVRFHLHFMFKRISKLNVTVEQLSNICTHFTI